MTTNPGVSEETAEERGQRWKDLVENFDRKLREKGLTDAQREELIKEILGATNAL